VETPTAYSTCNGRVCRGPLRSNLVSVDCLATLWLQSNPRRSRKLDPDPSTSSRWRTVSPTRWRDCSPSGVRKGSSHHPRDTFSIVTTEANELTDPIHDRMPVILHSRDYDRWLKDYDEARPPVDLLRPYESDGILYRLRGHLSLFRGHKWAQVRRTVSSPIPKMRLTALPRRFGHVASAL
jgi:hypothetical protein